MEVSTEQLRRNQIQLYEECSFNSWPALQTVLYNGWVLRISDGRSKRANSISALYSEAKSNQEDLIVLAEKLYSSYSFPTIFRLTKLAPDGMDLVLGELGYEYVDPCCVMVNSIPEVSFDNSFIQIKTELNENYYEGLANMTNVKPENRSSHRQVLSSIVLPKAFIRVVNDGEAIGYGLAVIDQNILGIFDLVIDEAMRGKGYGRKLLHGLLEWGRSLGAYQVYLQVTEDNQKAINLYKSLGFQNLYNYHYRIKA